MLSDNIWVEDPKDDFFFISSQTLLFNTVFAYQKISRNFYTVAFRAFASSV